MRTRDLEGERSVVLARPGRPRWAGRQRCGRRGTAGGRAARACGVGDGRRPDRSRHLPVGARLGLGQGALASRRSPGRASSGAPGPSRFPRSSRRYWRKCALHLRREGAGWPRAGPPPRAARPRSTRSAGPSALLVAPDRATARGARPSAGAPRRRRPGLPRPPPWPGCAAAAAGWSGAAGCGRAAGPRAGRPTHARRRAPPRLGRPRVPGLAQSRGGTAIVTGSPARGPGGPCGGGERRVPVAEQEERPWRAELRDQRARGASLLEDRRRTCLGPVQRMLDSRRPVSSFRTRSNHGPGPVSERGASALR